MENHDELHSEIVTQAIENGHDIAFCGVCHRVVFLSLDKIAPKPVSTVSIQ